jgi:hypothetical protein
MTVPELTQVAQKRGIVLPDRLERAALVQAITGKSAAEVKKVLASQPAPANAGRAVEADSFGFSRKLEQMVEENSRGADARDAGR